MYKKGKYFMSLFEIKHGLSRTRIYFCYSSMKQRCRPQSHCHKSYYDKGITICEEWLGENGFINFYNWSIENGYNDNLTLDRINNNGNYEPSNCRWATSKEQQNNISTNVFLTIDGEEKTISQWHEISGIPISTISRNIKKGLIGKDALKVKYHRKKSKIAQYDLNGKIIKIWNSPIEAARSFGLNHATGINSVCKKENNTSLGYGWSYYPEDKWFFKPNPSQKKEVYIDGEKHSYEEWAKILHISKKTFRCVCYKYNFDSEKLSEYKKKKLN